MQSSGVCREPGNVLRTPGVGNDVAPGLSLSRKTTQGDFQHQISRSCPSEQFSKNVKRGMGGPLNHKNALEATEGSGTGPGDYIQHHQSNDLRYNGGPSVLSRLQHTLGQHRHDQASTLTWSLTCPTSIIVPMTLFLKYVSAPSHISASMRL